MIDEPCVYEHTCGFEWCDLTECQYYEPKLPGKKWAEEEPGESLNTTQSAANSGIMAACQNVAAKFGELAAEIGELMDALVAAVNETWPSVLTLLEEIQEAMEDYDGIDQDEEDRHDAAVVIVLIHLPAAPCLQKLYGQGVDYGGLAYPV